MAATTQIISGHGAANMTGSPTGATTWVTTETQVDGTTIRFKRADNDTNNSLNPTPKPSSGTNYSWRKSFRLKVTVTPDGDIADLEFYTDGGSWGSGLTVNGHKKPVGNYDVASSADESALIAVDSGGSIVDAATWLTGAALSVKSGVMLSNPDTGYGDQDLVELQLAATTSASKGTKPSAVTTRQYTYRFNET